MWDEAGQVLEKLEFTAGRLTTRAGQPVADYPDVANYLEQHPDIWIPNELSRPLAFSAPTPSTGDPMRDMLEILASASDMWNPPPYVGKSRPSFLELARELRAQIDPRVSHESRSLLAIELPYHGLPAETALYLALRPLGLTCEYRYEQLWITTLEAAQSWERSPALPQLPTVRRMTALPPSEEDPFGGFANPDTLKELIENWRGEWGVSIYLGQTPAAAETLGAIKIDAPERISFHAALATICELHNLQYSVDGDEIVITARDK